MSKTKQLTKADFVKLFAKKANLKLNEADPVVNAFLATVEDALKDGYKVPFVGFGSFEVQDRSARTGRNPATGETLNIPASKTVKFKPGELLKKAVND